MKINTSLLIILAAASFSVHAQDKIYKTDGTVIDAKVTAVATATVTYKRYDNQGGPDYTILKKDVAQIKYENGTTDVIAGATVKENHRTYAKGGAKKEKYEKKYGDNILSIIPAGYTVSADGTMNDVGIGICYERLLDEKGHISFNLPILVSFSSSRDFNNSNLYYPNGLPTNINYNDYHSYFINPGVKFYPAPNRERVRYSLGLSFFAIFGSEPYAVYDNNSQTGIYPSGNYNYSLYGFMLSNSVNIAATKHFGMAIDLGAGIPISDNRFADNDGLDGLLGGVGGPFIQFGLRIGYIF
jgi:hypothetical protein